MNRNDANETGTTARFVAPMAMGLLLAWQFCLFPPHATSPLVGAFLSADQTALLNTCVILANALGAVAFFLTYHRLISRRFVMPACIAACACQAISLAVLLLASSSAAALCCGVLLGLATALWWTAWTVIIARLDVEVAEKAFIWALPLCAGGTLLPMLVGNTVATVIALGAIPLVLLGLSAWMIGRRSPQGDIRWSSKRVRVRELFKNPKAGGALMQALLAYLCVPLCRPTPGLNMDAFPLLGVVACSAGFVLGAGALWVFVTRTTHVDVFSSVRLVFPFLALGIVCCVGTTWTSVFCGLLTLSACHAVLECAIRLNVISLIRSENESSTAILACGLAIIGLGSVAGMAGSALFGAFGLSGTSQALFSFPLLMVIVVVAFMERGAAAPATQNESERIADNPHDKTCALMAARYQLTPRETEILSYLLEGRSHPFIRDEPGISKGTVDTHVRHIYAKTGVSCKQDLLSLAANERKVAMEQACE